LAFFQLSAPDGSGSGNINRFKGTNPYGNNSSEDYLAESFARSIYSKKDELVPGPAIGWANDELLNETFSLIMPGLKQW